MKESIPTLIYFTTCYWNQMGPDLYVSVENAFAKMLADAKRTPDRGAHLITCLRRELMHIYENPEYAKWLESAMGSLELSNEVGGAFILPDKVPILLQKLEIRNVPG